MDSLGERMGSEASEEESMFNIDNESILGGAARSVGVIGWMIGLSGLAMIPAQLAWGQAAGQAFAAIAVLGCLAGLGACLIAQEALAEKSA